MECCRVEGFPGYAYQLKSIILRLIYIKFIYKKNYRPGDHYTGGLVREQNKQTAFDLIKEIRKNVTKLNELDYMKLI